MSNALNGKIAAQIADALVAAGYSTCTPEHVWDVYSHGTVTPGTVSEEYDEALTDQIIDQLDAHGVKTP